MFVCLREADGAVELLEARPVRPGAREEQAYETRLYLRMVERMAEARVAVTVVGKMEVAMAMAARVGLGLYLTDALSRHDEGKRDE